MCAVYHCVSDSSTNKSHEPIQVRLKNHPVDLVGKIRNGGLFQSSSG